MERHYNTEAAAVAQRDYTDKHGMTMLAPDKGICPHCGMNIYAVYSAPRSGGIEMCGYSVEHAESYLITSCPFCNEFF